jgi:hypothetical protein
MTTKAVSNVFQTQEQAQRARQIRKEYRRRRFSETTVAVMSAMQVGQTMAQTTQLPATGGAAVVKARWRNRGLICLQRYPRGGYWHCRVGWGQQSRGHLEQSWLGGRW